jgi:shikimate dehydrogenase
MIKAAVLGSPISHSLSPLLHRTAYNELGLKAEYEAISIELDESKKFFLEALSQDWTGFSLTMPLKESIFDSTLTEALNASGAPLFDIDPIAHRMKSVNTLLRHDDTFYATSTDRTGFLRLFKGLTIRSALIIGGGGTARAALGALDGLCPEIHFILRSHSRSESLTPIALKSRLEFFGMDHSLANYDLIISTTPAGASDFILDRSHSESHYFGSDQIVFEVLYRPYPTRFLHCAKRAGLRTFDGLDLLVEQALDQITLFSGVLFDYTEMRKMLLTVAREALS